MQNQSSARLQILSRMLLTTAAAIFTVAFARPTWADDVTPPTVPGEIKVETGNEAFFVGHAVGTQNYVCVPSATGVGFALFTPEATLFNDDGKALTTHFFGPNPEESNTNPAVFATGTIRAAWQHSRDSSTVWGRVKPGNMSTDPAFVAPNAIPWLLVTVVGRQTGPAGGDALTRTTFIQRLNTAGGVAPSTGCNSSADLGHLAFAPYTADYFFFKASADHGSYDG